MAVEIRLKQVRESRGLSQFELAQKTGMSPQNIQKLEQGRAKGIQLDTLDSLCSALECEIQDLLVRVSSDQSAVSSSDAESQPKRLSSKKAKPESIDIQPGQFVLIPSGMRAWVDKVLENGRVAITCENGVKDDYPRHLLTVTEVVAG